MNFKENVTSNNKKTNMYVKSIKNSVTENEFKEAMERYGEVTSVCLREWKNKFATPSSNEEPQKFGFVNFKDPEVARNLILNHKKDQKIKDLVLITSDADYFVFYAQTKTERQQYLDSKNSNKMQSMHN